MYDVPENAPPSCPGTSSHSAGNANACEGCPNQQLCLSGMASTPLSDREPEVIAAIRKRLALVKHVLLILSGKGGVGKSTVSVCLARGLGSLPRHSLSDRPKQEIHSQMCYRVGLLDLDICGPSIPCLMGCIEEKVHQSQSGWSPVYVTDNISVMSAGFMLSSPDDAVIWRGFRKNSLIKDFLANVNWTEDIDEVGAEPIRDNEGKLDFLLIDTPPGTSDEHLSLIQYLKAADCAPLALIITTPQEIALLDVRKIINFCKKVKLPILGIVENMSEFVCSFCHQSTQLFPPSTGGAASLCCMASENFSICNYPPPLLCQLPLDPKLTRCLDEGRCPFMEASESDSG